MDLLFWPPFLRVANEVRSLYDAVFVLIKSRYVANVVNQEQFIFGYFMHLDFEYVYLVLKNLINFTENMTMLWAELFLISNRVF